MLVERRQIKNLIIIHLNSGDNILDSLKEAVEKHGIKNAVVLSGFGSARNHHFHVVANRDFPPVDSFVKEDAEGSDVLDLTGCIINGRIHIHITHSDSKVAYGGHLEPGVKAFTFLNIFLAEVEYDFDKFDAVGKIEDTRK